MTSDRLDGFKTAYAEWKVEGGIQWVRDLLAAAQNLTDEDIQSAAPAEQEELRKQWKVALGLADRQLK